jgi:peptidoglycan/LPS O-acetylase OafA/YrhL
VPLFFVVSGFCIHLPAAKFHGRGQLFPMNYRKYGKRRFWRLYPTHAFAIVGAIALTWLAKVYLKEAGAPFHNLQSIPWWVYLAHFAMVQAQLPWTTPYICAFNGALWTLETEVQLYVAYLLLLKISERWGWEKILYVLAVLNLIYWVCVDHFLGGNGAWHWCASTFFVGHLYNWCLGAYLVESLYSQKLQSPLRTIAITCLLMGVVVICIGPSTFDRRGFQTMLFAAWACVPLWYLVRQEAAGLEILRGRCQALQDWLSWVGERSYSLYLWHNPVLRLFIILFLIRASWIRENYFWGLGAGIMAIAAAYYTSMAAFWLVERHFLYPRSQTTPPDTAPVDVLSPAPSPTLADV